MAEVAHSFAYYTGLPLTGANITPAGGSALTTSRIVGDITEENEHRINEEDLDEDAHLVGERHDDKTRKISFTLSVPSGATLPEINTVVTIATAAAFANRYNGVWKIEKIGAAFKADKRVEIPVTLVRHEYLTYSAS
jgi:hypothetical protein